MSSSKSSFLRSKQLRNQFSNLPQPVQLEAIPVAAGQDDEYLRGLENYIDNLSKYINKIQAEEVKITENFSKDLANINVTSDKAREEEEKQREKFSKKLGDIRQRRTQLRELLYDALHERQKLWDSMLLHKEEEDLVRRKMNKVIALSDADKPKLQRQTSQNSVFSGILGVIQIALVLCFALGTEFVAKPSESKILGSPERVENIFTFYVNIALMVFVGFGFLKAYLKKYGYSAVGTSFLLGSFAFQWSVLATGFLSEAEKAVNDDDDDVQYKWERINIGIDNLIWGAYGATASLISLGPTLGRTTHLQQLVISFFGVTLFSINKWFGDLFHALDFGGSIFVFTFAAFYGLMVSRFSYKIPLCGPEKISKEKDKEDNDSSYESDLFSIFGTIFLWVLWPNFNAAFAPQLVQHRVIINTVLSLSASTVASFLSSRVLRGGKFKMEDIQRSTLAGGIALASVTSILITPGAALVVGLTAGLFSTFANVWLGPTLLRGNSLGIPDTLGTLSLFGIPGIIGSIGGVVSSAIAQRESIIYGQPISQLFPERSDDQAGWNVLALAVTLGIALIGGALVGIIVGYLPEARHFYSDETSWKVTADFDHHKEEEN